MRPLCTCKCQVALAGWLGPTWAHVVPEVSWQQTNWSWDKNRLKSLEYMVLGAPWRARWLSLEQTLVEITQGILWWFRWLAIVLGTTFACTA